MFSNRNSPASARSSAISSHPAICPRPTWSPSPPTVSASKPFAARLPPLAPPSPWTTAPTRSSWPCPARNSSDWSRRLRAESILWEDLPFSRAYHTPSFEPVVAPIADFFDGDDRSTCREFRSTPVRRAVRMPADVTSIRDLAVQQWTTTVAFRETIEAMHSDGLRLFVDVGARGNLAGFVEDILRGKPSFAVAANLPRRSGLAQLNHLVASLFAQGVPLNPRRISTPAGALARSIGMRRSRRLARPSSSRSGFRKCDSPNRSSASLRSAERQVTAPEHNGEETFATLGPLSVAHRESTPIGNGTSHHNHALIEPTAMFSPSQPRLGSLEELIPNSSPSLPYGDRFAEIPAPGAEIPSPAEDAMLAFQQTMQAFLQTQQASHDRISRRARRRAARALPIPRCLLLDQMSPSKTRQSRPN